MLPSTVERFRESHRATLPARYSGVLHVIGTSLGALLGIAFALSRLEHVRPLEWLTVPVAFLVANFAEYRAHKGPMHVAPRSPRSPLGLLYKRHAGQHHAFFTDEAMALDGARDVRIVLFPPVLLVFFIGLLLGPLALLVRLLVTANAAWLFAATGLAYFLTYEWLHLAYHAPASSLVSRLPIVRALARHHRTHHDPRRMRRWNFNITFPIFDALLGTRWRESSTER